MGPSTHHTDRPTMGSTSRVCHVFLRVFEFCCSVIVLGILGRAIYLANQADIYQDNRVIYGEITAAISTLFSIIFVAPFLYAFLAAPFDVVMFIMWMVVFALLANRVGTAMCDSWWYWNWWGWNWGRWYIEPVPDRSWSWYSAPGCAAFRAVLAFSFMASIAYLLSAILGAIIVSRYWSNSKPPPNRNISAPVATHPPTISHPETTQVGYTPTRPAPPAETTVGTAVNV